MERNEKLMTLLRIAREKAYKDARDNIEGRDFAAHWSRANTLNDVIFLMISESYLEETWEKYKDYAYLLEEKED